MGAYKTLDDLGDINGARALVRVDFNLPLKDGEVTDTTRVDRAMATIKDLRTRGANVVLASHLGRPKGTAKPEFSLSQIMPVLKERFEAIAFVNDCIGNTAATAIKAMPPRDILLLENTRFHKGEEANDPNFAKALAANADFYVNDAFSAAHRAHSSTEGVTHFLPSYAGRAMQAELEALGSALESPAHPVLAFVGGAKISTKLDLLSNLTKQVDMLVIGGAMANTFLAALDCPVGKSLYEDGLLDTARGVLSTAKKDNCKIILPTDVVVAKEFKAGASARTIPITQVSASDMILDVGTNSLAEIAQCAETAKTVVWNGPLGAFEIAPFDNGTNLAARHVAMLTKAGRLISVAGGGDTVAALNQAGVADDFTYVSTAGGAFLEWLEGKDLPGVEALKRA